MILIGYINKIYDIDLEDKIEEYIEEYDNIIEYKEEIYYKIISYEIDDKDYISDYNGSTFTRIKLEVEFLFVNEFEYDGIYDEYIETAEVPIIKNENHKYNILVLDFDFDNNFIIIIDEIDV